MMVEERERRANGEGVKPQGHLGEFDRHEVLVDAIDAAFQHHAADDMAIVKLLGVDRPAAFLGIAKDRSADRRYAGDQGRHVIGKGHEGLGLGHGRDDLIGQVVDKAYEKVAGPHGRIADFQFEKSLGRINPRKNPKAEIFGLVAAFQLARLRRKRFHPGRYERIDGFADDEPRQDHPACSSCPNLSGRRRWA